MNEQIQQIVDVVNGDSKLIQISFVQRFKTDTPPYPLTAR